MKKISFLTLLTFIAFFSKGQLTGSTTPTGPVVDVAGNNVGSGGCIYTNTPASSCPHICKNSFLIVSPNPANQSERKIIFNYYNPTSGNKNIRVLIKCGTTTLVDQCMNVSGNSNLRFYKEYNVICPNLGDLKVALTPFTGNDCGGTSCGETESSVAGSPLPVKFTSFTASRVANNVLLKWETASEQNNTGFAIERNTAGSWQQIAFVQSQANGGNSDRLLSYSYTDINANKGISQYRIRQIDVDSKSEYSEIRAVRNDGQPDKIIIYPNPSNNGKVNIIFDKNNIIHNISVTDISGRLVKEINGSGSNNVEINNLKPGMYILKIVDVSTATQTVEKIIVN